MNYANTVVKGFDDSAFMASGIMMSATDQIKWLKQEMVASWQRIDQLEMENRELKDRVEFLRDRMETSAEKAV